MPASERAAVVVVAGGAATRLPGKLALTVAGEPMIVRVVRNVGAQRETWIAAAGSFAPGIDARLPAPICIDRWPGRGPLGGLLTAFARVRAPRVFAVGGDMPHLDGVLLAELERRFVPGDRAVVPEHGPRGATRLEPLAALYDRLAFLDAGFGVLRAGRGSLHAVLERLEARVVRFDDERAFRNVNTPEDYRALDRS